MKILHVIPHFLPSRNFGGTPVACANLAYSQADLGHEVSVLTTDAFSKNKRYFKKNEKINEVKVYRVKNVLNSLAFRYKISTPYELLKIYYFIRNFEVVHLHEYRTILNVLVAIFHKKTQVIILNPHGTLANYNTRQLIKKIFDIFFARLILKAINGYVALSNVEKNDFIKAGISEKEIFVVPDGILIPQNVTLKNQIKSPYILYLGRIDKRKKIDILIRAFSLSRLHEKGVKLIIAGPDDGYMNKILKVARDSKLQKHISFLGAVGDEKWSLYKNALATYYLTEREAFGIVPLESIVMGTVPIISKNSGVAEYLPKGTTQIINIITDKKIAEVLTLLSFKKTQIPASLINIIRVKLSWPRVANKMINIYNQVLLKN